MLAVVFIRQYVLVSVQVSVSTVCVSVIFSTVVFVGIVTAAISDVMCATLRVLSFFSIQGVMHITKLHFIR